MSGNCYYCGGHPDETVDLRRRRDELEAENDRLRAELARSSERIDERFRQMEERELLGSEIGQALVDKMKARAETAEARLAEAQKALKGMDLMMRGVDAWPHHHSIVGHVDAFALRALRTALVSSPVTEKTDG